MQSSVEVQRAARPAVQPRWRRARGDGPSVSIQGELGSFGHVAALQALGEEAQVLQCRTFRQAFEAVARKDAECAVLPIENSLVGSVHETYDLLAEYGLPIVGETEVRVSLSLLARPGARLESVRRVHSHPAALSQCRRFLASLVDVEPVAAYDTAGSIWEVMERGSIRDGAIGSPFAARLYGASVLAVGVEDDPQNFTRFLVVARTPVSPRGTVKTSLLITLRHETGSLWRALEPLARRGLNVTKIESRPLRGRPWEYVFYLDVVGPESGSAAVSEMEGRVSGVRVLGSYGPSVGERR